MVICSSTITWIKKEASDLSIERGEQFWLETYIYQMKFRIQLKVGDSNNEKNCE